MFLQHFARRLKTNWITPRMPTLANLIDMYKGLHLYKGWHSFKGLRLHKGLHLLRVALYKGWHFC